MTMLRVAGRPDPHARFHAALAESARQVRRWEAAKRQGREGAAAGGSRPGVPAAVPVARLRREAAWLCFAATLVTGGALWALLLFAPASPLVDSVKVAAVLILAGAGAAAIVRGLLFSEGA